MSETTQYGRVDLTLHPILRRAYDQAIRIEALGCGEKFTEASSEQFAFLEALYDVMVKAKILQRGLEDAGKTLMRIAEWQDSQSDAAAK